MIESIALLDSVSSPPLDIISLPCYLLAKGLSLPPMTVPAYCGETFDIVWDKLC